MKNLLIDKLTKEQKSCLAYQKERLIEKDLV